MSYQIAADGKSITCGQCGRTSYHATDVLRAYCGHCHAFHEAQLLTECDRCHDLFTFPFDAKTIPARCPKCNPTT